MGNLPMAAAQAAAGNQMGAVGRPTGVPAAAGSCAARRGPVDTTLLRARHGEQKRLRWIESHLRCTACGSASAAASR